MLLRLVALTALLSASLPSVSALVDVPFTNTCTGHITNITVQANEWPPAANTNLNLVLAGDLDEVVSSGTYHAKATFDWIPILDKNGSIADVTTLPMPRGKNIITKSVKLPSVLPWGAIDITVTAQDASGSDLVCVEIKTTTGARAAVEAKKPIMVHNFASEAATASVPVPYTNCGSSSDIITISSLSASVWPPVAGQALTVTGSASSSEEITAGSFEATVSYMGIQLIDKKGDLSSVTPLPVQAGSATLSKTVTLPSTLPSGSYVIQASGKDQNGRPLGCVNLAFSL